MDDNVLTLHIGDRVRSDDGVEGVVFDVFHGSPVVLVRKSLDHGTIAVIPPSRLSLINGNGQASDST